MTAACGLGPGALIHPVYVKPFKEHDLTVGAGWAWKSWEREDRIQARKDVQSLVAAQRPQCPNLKEPVVISGRAVQVAARFYLANSHDLIVIGTPFRGLHSIHIAQRFQEAIRRKGKDLPLWIVLSPKPIRRAVALTDGSDTAEKALGFLNRVISDLHLTVTLISLKRKNGVNHDTEALILERGFAILKEKGVNADGFASETLPRSRLGTEISNADLLVVPFSSGPCVQLFEQFGRTPPSLLFYLDGA